MTRLMSLTRPNTIEFQRYIVSHLAAAKALVSSLMFSRNQIQNIIEADGAELLSAGNVSVD